MARYRSALPQLGLDAFLGDGGLETTLVFHEGQELPDFAAFHLLATPGGRAVLRRYFEAYAEVAQRLAAGLVLETPTWRSNADWGKRLGYAADALARANREAVELVEDVRDEYETPETPIVISGCIGPRGDGYVTGDAMSASEAAAYHVEQIETFADTAADFVAALTMNYVEEAMGVATAARQAGIPAAISFTVETDGTLPSGQRLGDAIGQVDDATSGYPSYYMINCAHPTHFASSLDAGEPWVARIRGLKANSSRMSHAELDAAPELDVGDPAELGREYAELKARIPGLTVLGGCCGTDHRHIEQIGTACLPLFRGEA